MRPPPKTKARAAIKEETDALVIDSGYVTPYVVIRPSKPFDPIAMFKTLGEARPAYPRCKLTADAENRALRDAICSTGSSRPA